MTEIEQRKQRSNAAWAGLRPQRHSSRRALVGLGGLLAAVVVMAIGQRIFSHPDRVALADRCVADATQSAVWDWCPYDGLHAEYLEITGLRARSAHLVGASLVGEKLPNADMSYAELAGANLSLAAFQDARLVGVRLTNARLDFADFSGSDLRFADLSGSSIDNAKFAHANLSGAIWVDGHTCPPHSIGECR